jgi:hypothetical protein
MCPLPVVFPALKHERRSSCLFPLSLTPAPSAPGTAWAGSTRATPTAAPFFYQCVLNLLLSQRFGLNVGGSSKVHDAYKAAVRDLRRLGHRSRPVHPRAVAPFLGYYEGGYRLVIRDRDVRILFGGHAAARDARQ